MPPARREERRSIVTHTQTQLLSRKNRKMVHARIYLNVLHTVLVKLELARLSPTVYSAVEEAIQQEIETTRKQLLSFTTAQHVRSGICNAATHRRMATAA